MTYIKAIKSLLSCFLAYQMVFSPAVSFAQFDPAALVPLSKAYNPIIIKGLQIFPDNPLRFDFIVANGDKPLSDDLYKKESENLIKYFMASLAVPEKDMWVNLSPYEKNRIIPQTFNQTQMGIDLLAQDYLLKQITASLMYPDGVVGKQFWAKVNAQAKEKFNISEVPIETFNKVWIVPDVAEIYVHNNVAYIVNSRLKVMLEKDYLALKNSRLEKPADAIKRDDNEMSQMATRAVKEIVIPVLDKEVNEGKHFALLRQIYNSMLLATWYKHNVKNSIVNEMFSDHNKPGAAKTENPGEKDAIYQKYVGTFQKGVYNYIKEEYDAKTDEMVPRKYFSGGVALVEAKPTTVGGSSVTERLRETLSSAKNGFGRVAMAIATTIAMGGVGMAPGPAVGAPVADEARATIIMDKQKVLDIEKRIRELIAKYDPQLNQPEIQIYASEGQPAEPKITIGLRRNVPEYEFAKPTYIFYIAAFNFRGNTFGVNVFVRENGEVYALSVQPGYEAHGNELFNFLAEERPGVGSDFGVAFGNYLKDYQNSLPENERTEILRELKAQIAAAYQWYYLHVVGFNKDIVLLSARASGRVANYIQVVINVNDDPEPGKGPVNIRVLNLNQTIVSFNTNNRGEFTSTPGVGVNMPNSDFKAAIAGLIAATYSSSEPPEAQKEEVGRGIARQVLRLVRYKEAEARKTGSAPTAPGVEKGDKHLGGIDLDPGKTKMTVSGQGIEMIPPGNPEDYQNLFNNEIAPNILQIQNIPNIPMLLGLEESGLPKTAADPEASTPNKLPVSTPAGEQIPS